VFSRAVQTGDHGDGAHRQGIRDDYEQKVHLGDESYRCLDLFTEEAGDVHIRQIDEKIEQHYEYERPGYFPASQDMGRRALERLQQLRTRRECFFFHADGISARPCRCQVNRYVGKNAGKPESPISEASRREMGFDE